MTSEKVSENGWRPNLQVGKEAPKPIGLCEQVRRVQICDQFPLQESATKKENFSPKMGGHGFNIKKSRFEPLGIFLKRKKVLRNSPK